MAEMCLATKMKWFGEKRNDMMWHATRHVAHGPKWYFQLVFPNTKNNFLFEMWMNQRRWNNCPCPRVCVYMFVYVCMLLGFERHSRNDVVERLFRSTISIIASIVNAPDHPFWIFNDSAYFQSIQCWLAMQTTFTFSNQSNITKTNIDDENPQLGSTLLSSHARIYSPMATASCVIH